MWGNNPAPDYATHAQQIKTRKPSQKRAHLTILTICTLRTTFACTFNDVSHPIMCNPRRAQTLYSSPIKSFLICPPTSTARDTPPCSRSMLPIPCRCLCRCRMGGSSVGLPSFGSAGCTAASDASFPEGGGGCLQKVRQRE